MTDTMIAAIDLGSTSIKVFVYDAVNAKTGHFHCALDAGFYLPPAQFEAAFISAAHTEADVDALSRCLLEAD